MNLKENKAGDPPLDRNWRCVNESYKLVRKLGSGSSGEVVYAINRVTK